MKYLYIKQALIVAALALFVGCSQPISGPIDEFPNYINIKVAGEPVVGNTRVYLVAPSVSMVAGGGSSFFVGTTDSGGNLKVSRESYSGILNITAVNGEKGVFVDSIDFTAERDIEVQLDYMGAFVVAKEIPNEVFYAVYGTPWFGVIGPSTLRDTINIPHGDYNIVFSTDGMFENVILSSPLGVERDSMQIINLQEGTEDTSMTVAMYMPQSGVEIGVGEDAVAHINSGVRIINGLYRDAGVFTVAHQSSLRNLIVEQVQDDGVEFYITNFLFLDAPQRYNIENMNDTTDMTRLYSGLRYVFESIGSRAAKVVIEPKLVGKLALQIVAGTQQSVLVPDDIGGLREGDLRSFFAAVIGLRNQYAPNAHIGFYVSDDIRINETSPGIMGLVDQYIDSLAAFWHEFLVSSNTINEIQFLTLGVYDTSLTHFSLFNSMSEWQLERYLMMGEALSNLSSKEIYLFELPVRKSLVERSAYIVPLGTAGYDRSLSRFFFRNLPLFREMGFYGIIYSGEPLEAIDLVQNIN